jgi:Condensation domain/AMP-binding enzyme
VYGPTEAGISALECYCPPSVDIITLGRPVYNMHTYVVDSERRPVAVGVPGELLLSGPRLALGYAGQADLTANKFISNPCLDLVSASIDPSLAQYYHKAYRTGDLVRWCSDGTLEYLGRIDRQVKVMGVRIELGEVENVLSAAPGVTMAVAAMRVDPRVPIKYGSDQPVKRLVGWVMPSTVDSLVALQHCASSLVPAAVPVDLVALDAFPLTANGKVDFKALPDPPAWHALPSSSTIDATNNGGSLVGEEEDDMVSEAVKLAWKEVFGDVVSLVPTLDFFSQGGNSLDVMRSNAAVADFLGLASPPQTTLIYKTRTLEATIVAFRELYKSNNNDTTSAAAATAERQQGPSLLAQAWPDATRPLSAGQEQMWTLATLTEPEYTSAYVVGAAFRIVGSLDVAKLQQALTAVASRHEVLRMRYAMVGKKRSLSGIVAMADVYKVTLRTVLLENDEPRKVQEALRAEFSLPWDLEAGPLMRAALIQIPGSNAAILCLALHHAVSDDWSMTVFCRELSVVYNFLSGQEQPEAAAEVPLKALPLQYADFAAWQKKKSPLVVRTQLEYWRGVLKGAPQVLQLPTDYPRPIVPSLKGSTLSSLSLPPGLLQQLRELAFQLQISLAALMLAAFHTLLAKICDTEDVVVGVPVAQRGLSAVQQLVGYFITPVAVRASLDPDSSFGEVAQAVQSALAGAMENSDISFQDIVQGLGLGNVKRSHTPVFQVNIEEPNLYVTESSVVSIGLSYMIFPEK